MAKAAERRRTVYYCRECGNESARWMGFCPSPQCDSTSPLVEGNVVPAQASSGARRSGWLAPAATEALSLADVSVNSQPRIALPSNELNRVLGGGIVPGSISLLTGEPGVGKSTLLLQLAHSLSSSTALPDARDAGPVMYVSGEESPVQVKLRAERMGINGQGILLLTETDVDSILERLEKTQPGLVIVDSIQTLQCEGESSGPGSVGQLPAPRRVSNGVDHNRLLMLTAVASRRTGLEIGAQDVIVSVAGGFRATEPAADLAIILAIASCYRNAPLSPAAAFGEVGLSAEIRAVPHAQRRVNEAARLGLTRCILPQSSLREIEPPKDMQLIGAETVGQAIRAALTTPQDELDLAFADE
ncbi:DNA repair protein RadA [Geodia barretti]|uniref:DNA repair protein RadA n=1 Tax=Geodia barretti TaxID=519541 RepID=A0AA35RNT3_GEOBA|nr:DNA repair protein RadA [Geodia barretti]